MFVRIFAKNIITMVATNISDFRSNIKQYVDQVLNEGSAVIINRGNTAAVGTTPAEVENGIAAFISGRS